MSFMILLLIMKCVFLYVYLIVFINYLKFENIFEELRNLNFICFMGYYLRYVVFVILSFIEK